VTRPFAFALALTLASFGLPASASTAAPSPSVATSSVAAAARALDIEVPRNDGWVTDLAGLLSPSEEQSLEALMESYRQGTKHEIALLTVPDLKGQPIERFALEVGRAWGIGGKEQNNGALLVVSKADRSVRIEVGRGLEGNLTDSISGRIIRDVIVPRFKRGDFPGGLRQGIEAIHSAIGGDYGKLPKNRAPVSPEFVGVTVQVFLIVLFLFVAFLSRLFRRGRRRHAGVFPGMFIPPIGLGRGHGGGRSSGGGFTRCMRSHRC
jgi:uncharacterized protein